MKRTVIMLALLAAAAGIGHAQAPACDSMRHHTVKINPIAVFHPAVFYEYDFASRHGLEVSVGGAPKINHLRTNQTNVLFATLSYRWYFLKLHEMHFFVQGGGCLMSTWGRYDIFDGSDGWDIRTRRYAYSDTRLAPCIGFGFRFVPARHLTFEVAGMAPLGGFLQRDGNSLVGDILPALYFTQLIGLKIGYTF